MNFEQRLPKHPFEWIRQQAEQSQTTCYVIGGYVRDLVLGRPNEDIDILVMGEELTSPNNWPIACLKNHPYRYSKPTEQPCCACPTWN